MIAVAALIYLAMSIYTRHGSALTVPDVTGLLYEDAKGRLEDEGLEVVISDSVYTEGKKSGEIAEQNPVAGSEVKSGRMIYLIVQSDRPPEVDMPALIDLSLREANGMLEARGLKLGKVIYRPGLGAVLQQQFKGYKIPAGTKVRKGMAIDLVVGTGVGNEKVNVPDLKGLTRGQVINALTATGLSLGFEKFEGRITDTLRARVVRQYPAAGPDVTLNTGEPVDVYYSNQ